MPKEIKEPYLPPGEIDIDSNGYVIADRRTKAVMTSISKDYPALEVFKKDCSGLGYNMTATEFYAAALDIDQLLTQYQTLLSAVSEELDEKGMAEAIIASHKYMKFGLHGQLRESIRAYLRSAITTSKEGSHEL